MRHPLWLAGIAWDGSLALSVAESFRGLSLAFPPLDSVSPDSYSRFLLQKESRMDQTPDEDGIRRDLDKYLEGKAFRYNPDREVVDRVIRGLAKRKGKTGKVHCPCRLLTGKSEADDRIVCPCVHHEEEIERQGFCHCRLFVR